MLSTRSNIKYIILVGIGGSNLGTKAVYEALRLPSASQDKPEILFADTVSPVMREGILARIKGVPKDQILLNYVSKSGTTLETKENFEFLKEYAGEIVDTYKDLEFDKSIGGRFSVLTEVGLFPLRLCGVDIEALLRGKADVDAEEARKSAKWMYERLQSGMVVFDTFLFNPEFESLGKWYRQLLGESTGKDGKGYFPTVSIGTTDLHSIHQRVIGGPRNIATNFVFGRHNGDNTMSVIYEATKNVYSSNELPFMEYIMPKIDEYEIGKFFQFKILEVIELANLMGVNAFDQPSVEAYKSEARRLLQ